MFQAATAFCPSMAALISGSMSERKWLPEAQARLRTSAGGGMAHCMRPAVQPALSQPSAAPPKQKNQDCAGHPPTHPLTHARHCIHGV